MDDFLLFLHCNYSYILYHFPVIWHWIILWPWNLTQRSLKVIETGAIWKLGCSFLFAFYSTCNYGHICSLAWVRWGPRVWGSALLVVDFSVLVSILLCSLSMSGVTFSTQLMGVLRFRGSCSWRGERKGSWMVGYLCSCPGCAVTRHLGQSYDLWHFRVFGGSPACYCHLVVIFNPA